MQILALNVEISIIRHKIKRNSGVTGINQLKFWRDALETLGERKGPLPRLANFLSNVFLWNSTVHRQPVMLALSAFDWREDLPLLQSLVESRQQVRQNTKNLIIYS
jgi:hypothetical protein